jgi:hypothetical protein
MDKILNDIQRENENLLIEEANKLIDSISGNEGIKERLKNLVNSLMESNRSLKEEGEKRKQRAIDLVLDVKETVKENIVLRVIAENQQREIEKKKIDIVCN